MIAVICWLQNIGRPKIKSTLISWNIKLVSAFCRSSMQHGVNAIYVKQQLAGAVTSDINSLSVEGSIEYCEVGRNAKRTVLMCV